MSGKSEPQRAHNSGRGFFWQGLLILLPLGVLASAGLWSLRGQREAVEQRAREQSAAAAGRAAAALEATFETRLRAAHRGVPLLPADEVFPFLYDRNPAPPDDLLPDHQFREAGDDGEKLAALLEEHADAKLASGLPLKPLVLHRLVQLAEDADRADLLARLETAAIETHPSILSGPLLEDVQSGALAVWSADQARRERLRQNLPEIRARQHSCWSGDWRIQILEDPDRSGRRLVFVAGGEELGADLPVPDPAPYAQFVAELGGVPVTPVPEGETLATATSGDVAVAAILTKPDILYAQQRRQATWFVGIIAGAALTALIGLWVTRHAYLKQQAVNRMKSNFVSSVSHELRAPIASIRLMAERLRSGRVKEPEKRGEYFGFIEQESRRLTNLVENVLDFSRIEDGRKTYRFEATDIAKLVRDATHLMQPHATEHEVTLATELHPPAENPSLDALEIQQALVNLIDNAIKYSPQGETVTVGLGNGSPDRFSLWVEDRGRGIPREEQAKIFQRFYRVGSELERETQGVGIGLSIVRHTAEAHGGRVTVDSKPGAGSRFTLELPIRQQA